jgi:hypothetical protein
MKKIIYPDQKVHIAIKSKVPSAGLARPFDLDSSNPLCYKKYLASYGMEINKEPLFQRMIKR